MLYLRIVIEARGNGRRIRGTGLLVDKGAG
jgi:hypothetical protein